MSRINKKKVFFIIAQCIIQINCNITKERPKIKTSDGDLILEPAPNKNIYLRSNGPRSGIFIGNSNVLNITSTRNLYQPSGNQNGDQYFRGKTEILQRLEVLENRPTVSSSLTMLNVTLFTRKMQRLARKSVFLQIVINDLLKVECDAELCQHGGTCLNLVGGYHCLCPSNWKGKNCDVDVNECRNFAGTDLGCQNGATCINRPGTYECLCKSNWRGLHCTTQQKDCSAGDFEMCGHGTCISVQSDIECICHQGWTSNATSVACLTDINECDASQGRRCSVNPRVECINLPGSFRCGQCPAGYQGDGYVCYDVDECTTVTNGGCSPLVTCHNTIGSRICGSCPSGYEGDGVTCTYSGSCNINHGGCHPSAQCVEASSPTGQSTLCTCPDGMDGDGIGLLGCFTSTNNATGGCENNPCGNYGRCHSLRFGYTCICHKGYSGSHCETATNLCAVNPCQNDGICRQDDNVVMGFRCECTARFSGSLCQVRSEICGGILDAEEGNIAYPLSNTTSYNHNSQCAWVIHTLPYKVINVTFSKFNVERTPGCLSDFLQIHDGRQSSSQLIGRFCGTIFPKGGNIISSQNYLYLWFHSDKTIARAGFALHWTSEIPICGGLVDATTHGRISSPGSPGPYPPDRDCFWTLRTSPGKRISLHFFALDIESHTNCSFDYLAVYDGENDKDPLISKYCNSSQPAPVQSASSSIFIHFHSDSYGSGNGFQIIYAPTEGTPGCGGYFTADKGEIVSPSFNGQYLSNLLCEYKIKTSVETKIKIDFKFFQLENSHRCKNDFIKIYDGSSSDSRLVGMFCGTTHPSTFTSTSNLLYLKFRSDSSTSSKGFRLSYEAKCEKTIFGNSGVIMSPMYPFSYPANKICIYIITTEPGKAIQLTFQDFDIEDNGLNDCQYDYVEIRDGHDINSTLLGKFCGGTSRTPPVQTSTHNYMYITFKSDMSLSGTGFYANYTTVEVECGGIYRTITGLINYPAEDIKYKHQQFCQWLLVAPEGMRIKLTWNRFEIEDEIECSSDYLELIEINDNNDNHILGKFCGINIPPALTTYNNRLKLKFVSDEYLNYGGFSVSYTFLDERTHCGGEYLRSHGYIYSPGWPQSYTPNRDCVWVITVPVGQQISLNISDFDLEPPLKGTCKFGDYLEIKNGGLTYSTMIGKYCGKFNYKRITSLANVLYIHFYSDFYLTGKGFQIEWDSTITGCGGTLTSSIGSISSPNYPNNYPENAECFYKIVTSAGSRINIVLYDLDLERSGNCRDDYLEIYDGRGPNSPSLGRHCSLSSKSSIIFTTTNFAFLKFRSDMWNSGRGFTLNYDTICNNNMTGRHGTIESPNFPNKYPPNTKCLWTIEVYKSNKINVTFTYFDVNSIRFTRHRWQRLNDSCISDYLQTKEKSDKYFSKKLCGTVLPSLISTRSNLLQIQFTSGNYETSHGFRLEWVSYGCGGHIQRQSGIVSYDKNIPNENEIECEWLIETTPGKEIGITFTDIFMLDSPNCTIDVIEIYNGPNTRAPLISKTCHKNIAYMESDSNFMVIRFVKRSSQKNVGFTLQYYSTKAKCGGLITSMSGFIYSKNYPKNYENNLDCIWYLRGPTNHRYEINFMDLDLYSEIFDADDDECNDVILIYDDNNYSPSSNYTYRICPNSKIKQIVTKYNNVAIQFKTNNLGSAKGFKANFSITCGALISTSQNGIVKNSKFINNLNHSCIWTIISSAVDQKISLTLTHMSLPKNTNIITNRNCPSTFLRVLDGNDKDAPLIGEYCGRKVPPIIVSRGNAVTIELGSYSDRIEGIFSAHYSTVTNACGGTLTSEEGTIASPAYPGPYPANIDCEWLLSSSPGNTAYVMFEIFNLESSEDCNEDYLEIREKDRGGPLLGVYCGNDIPTNNTKATNMYIKFHSDSKTSGRGFLLHYSYLHDNDFQGNNGEITSPLYPLLYEGVGEYSWRILSLDNSNIFITVYSLEIPSYGDVNYNKLIIYDGYDNTAPVLEQFQGAFDERKTIQASSNVVYIKLMMDESNTGSKFRLSWTTSVGNEALSDDLINCGSNLTELVLPGQVKTVKSPNYPERYGNDLNCEWLYKTQIGRQLFLSFVEFEIAEAPSCFIDKLSVYLAESPGNWYPIQKEICSSTAVRQGFIASTYMKIMFTTSHSYSTRKGFLGKVHSKCGGLIIAPSGEIGPLWIDVFSTNPQSKLKCNWTIKVRPGRTITAKFSFFNITNEKNDCSDSVVLRNGDSPEAPLLGSGRYCGYEHEKKEDIVTSSNSLYITYTSIQLPYQPIIFQSFKLYYEEISAVCGSTSILTSEQNFEIISSPNYPFTAIPYSECVWIFTGPPGELIRIDFIDKFDIDATEDCGTEAIEIRDGLSMISPLIGQRYCGRRPGTLKSSGNTMYVKYFTQLAEPSSGFKANVSIDVCGGTIIATSGELTSPGYPRMLLVKESSTCEWRVVGPQNYVFLIKSETIYLPNSAVYCGTKLTIEETNPLNNTQVILKTICSNDIYHDTVETLSNNFIIKLTVGKPSKWKPEGVGFRISYNSSYPRCYGRITAFEGYLNTPSYPQETSLMFCQWLIEVPNKSRRIRLEIIDSNQAKHKIVFYNDFTAHSKILTIPNSDNLTNTRFIESVGNKLAIYIWPQPLATSHRFKARFSSDESALCGETLSSLSEELISPNLQRAYTCQWHYNNQLFANSQIRNLNYNSIFLTVKINATETNTKCKYFEPQQIIIIANVNFVLFKRTICGSIEESYRIPSHIMDIKIVNSKVHPFNFQLNWKSQPCGGSVIIGTIPKNILNIPISYNDTIDCAWLIKVPDDNKLKLKLEGSFSLECNDEYFTISRSFNQNDPAIGRYCKDNVMETTKFNFAYMYIQYHLTNNKNSTIKLMAEIVAKQCGGLLTAYQNIFTSPNYPKSYNANQECTWEIKAEIGFRVSLKFIDRFVIESTKNCSKDAVIIYDWKNDAYEEIARICGRQASLSYNSTYNKLKVVFHTDAETNLDGFKAQWISICGGNYIATDKEQILYSPGYYSSRTAIQCTYEITAPYKQKVLLKFLDFELTGHPPYCNLANLTVIASSDTDYDEFYQVFCGKKNPATIKYEIIKLTFKNYNNFVLQKGFKLSFSVNTCGSQVNDTTIITSNFDEFDKYDSNMNCTWVIEAPPSKIVVVKFLFIELENTHECNSDYIALYNGPKIDVDKRLSLLCGYINSTTTLSSTGNKMLLQFVSDSDDNFKGFRALIYFSYSEAVGCGGRINLIASYSHNLKYPPTGYAYENFLDCHWSIISPPNTVIRIAFHSFHISPCQNLNQTAIGYGECDCDFVEIRDGLNIDNLVIGTYCGHTLPPQLTSSENVLSIKFSSDGEFVDSGFEVTLTVQPTLCGQSVINVTRTPRRFKSPGYDTGSIPRGLHCAYHLDFDSKINYSGSLIRISIINVQLSPPVSEGGILRCTKDRLIISSMSSPSNITARNNLKINSESDFDFGRTFLFESNVRFPKRYELCGQKKAVDFYVYQGATLNLITSPEIDNKVHNGIEIEVSTVGFCGRNYTEPQGRVHSNYGMNDGANIDCYTLITAPENHTISAYFLSLVPDYSSTGTYIEIFDGNKTTEKQIVKIQNYNNYPVFSTGRYMLLHSHRTYYHIRYDMNYITTDKGSGCGGKLNNIVGAITSPLYPNPYRKVSICEWELETPIGTHLKIRFNDFDVGVLCDQNYLQFVDSKRVVVRTFCSERPADFTSTDNYLKLVYKSSQNNAGKGWAAEFVATI